MPFWAANALQDQALGTMDIPKIYSKTVNSNILADPKSVDLPSFSKYYYELGASLTKIMLDMGQPKIALDIFKTIINSLVDRFQNIVDKAQNAGDEDNSKFLQNLTNLESELFHAGYSSSLGVINLKKRAYDKISSFNNIKRIKLS